MWIGFAVVLMLGGEFSTGAASYDTEAECRAEAARMLAKASAHPGVKSHHIDCVPAAKFLTAKKVKPASSKAPGPTTNPS